MIANASVLHSSSDKVLFQENSGLATETDTDPEPHEDEGSMQSDPRRRAPSPTSSVAMAGASGNCFAPAATVIKKTRSRIRLMQDPRKDVAGSHYSVNTSGKGNNGSKASPRLIAIRYVLDRPGYDLDNAAARLWWDPPAIVHPSTLNQFLQDQNIALPGLLVEVWIDTIQGFLLLEACEAAMLEWDFNDASPLQPGRLDVRLTDVLEAQEEESISELEKQGLALMRVPRAVATAHSAVSPHWALANVTPSGLFSFSMMVGLETAHVSLQLAQNDEGSGGSGINESYLLAWGPYMFFVGGLMQILVAVFQVLRNNVYGATAFFGFGCFWFSNGLTSLLEIYDVDREDAVTKAGTLLTHGGPEQENDPWGTFLRLAFIGAFCGALLVQTFAMNKLSSALISLLTLKVLCSMGAIWYRWSLWMQCILGWMTSLLAFYVFLVEFTNQVYHREVFSIYRWHEDHSPQEVFGASGKSGTLHSKAARLRQAKYTQPHIVMGREIGAGTSRRRVADALFTGEISP